MIIPQLLRTSSVVLWSLPYSARFLAFSHLSFPLEISLNRELDSLDLIISVPTIAFLRDFHHLFSNSLENHAIHFFFKNIMALALSVRSSGAKNYRLDSYILKKSANLLFQNMDGQMIMYTAWQKWKNMIILPKSSRSNCLRCAKSADCVCSVCGKPATGTHYLVCLKITFT